MFAVTDTADVTTSKSADMAVPELRQNLILPTLLAPEALPATVLPSRSARERRHAKYARRLIFSDGVIICLSIFSAQILRFWDQPVPVSSPWAWSAGFGYTLVSCLLAVLWMGFLSLGSRSAKVAGRGLEEYAVLVAATLQLFGLAAIASMLLHVDVSRGYLAIALPLGLTGLVVNRWGWRHYTARIRRRGMDQDRLLIVGTAVSAHDVATEFAKDPWAGYQIVGICTPEGPTEADASISVGGQPIPVVGMSQAILDAVQRTGVHTVALAATHGLRPVDVRRLMWELDALQVDLMLAPGMIDIADRRLHSRPVAGMAMFEIVKPQYSRANSLIKRSFDIVFALVALLLVSPVMVATALAVRLTSRGPTFYRSERIGMDGAPFRMTKFRSMFVDAESRMPALIAANGGNALFFKMKDDPRVTRVGRLIRKFSIDELPQFFDVLRGTMSVVGPRPQVRREVDSYDDLVSRRLTVKPGLTGLWQISGRSDLAVEDAIRLDLTYVENWSLYRDLIIIVKTVRTVLLGSGAY
ncbi:sugar transferase [Mycolicibacterium hodleri]|uniref:sugar transferase n=1 Tax=Mycolicibacterium hodleri TaxID=49897 RepID=UPI0021F3795C|nr:sugar transferase [Mycolicibacterium hodleri]